MEHEDQNRFHNSCGTVPSEPTALGTKTANPGIKIAWKFEVELNVYKP